MKTNTAVTLLPISRDDREKFIADVQTAFSVAAKEEFGEDVGEVIPRSDIEQSLDAKGAEIYHIVYGEEIVGGTVIVINPVTHRNSLDLLFINTKGHCKGIGFAAWKAIEQLHPETEVWETHTPYFEKRNIHFYVNKCGFHIVEFYNPFHPMPHKPSKEVAGGEYFFHFEKKMK